MKKLSAEKLHNLLKIPSQLSGRIRIQTPGNVANYTKTSTALILLQGMPIHLDFFRKKKPSENCYQHNFV